MLAACRAPAVSRGPGTVGQLPNLSWVHRQVVRWMLPTPEPALRGSLAISPGGRGFWVSPTSEARTGRSLLSCGGLGTVSSPHWS